VEVQKCLSTPVEDTGPVVLLGFSNLAGRNIVEQAPVGSGYDFVVHVKNVPTYSYNPEVPTDTAALGYDWPGNTVEEHESSGSA
jgi:hypothetical protein